MSKEHWKTVPDSNVRHIWRGEDGTTVVVDPSFYGEAGTPIDPDTGEDLRYVETQIRAHP